MDMERVKAEVADLLRTWHRGPDSAIPRRKVLEFLEYVGLKVSDRTLRRIYTAIPEVRSSCGRPRKGLYWSDDLEEARRQVSRERDRGLACMARGSRAYRALQARRQPDLFPGQGARP